MVGVKMMNKCSVVFVIGMAVATASYAFFGNWVQQGMAMPQKMLQMPTQMVMPPSQDMVQSQQPCACVCKTN